MEMLDLGVIMSSSADWVFEDMVERYPGAKWFYSTFQERNDNPTSARKECQGNLHHLFDGDKERCATFFEKLSHFDQQPTPTRVQEILAGMGLIVTTGDQRRGEKQEMMKHLEEWFGPGNVRPIQPLD